MTPVLIRRGRFGDTETQTYIGRKSHVKKGAEIGVTQLQAKECRGPATTRTWKKARKDSMSL